MARASILYRKSGQRVAPWIERVAKIANVDPVELRDVYRARLVKQMPPRFDARLLQAAEWLEMPEEGLEQHVYLDTKQANVLFPFRGGTGPRFVYYHTKRSRYSPAGFLDDVVVDRTKRLYHQWENKREDAPVRPEQQFWIDMLQAGDGSQHTCAGFHVVCHGIVRPSDWYTSVRQRVLGF